MKEGMVEETERTNAIRRKPWMDEATMSGLQE